MDVLSIYDAEASSVIVKASKFKCLIFVSSRNAENHALAPRLRWSGKMMIANFAYESGR